MFNFERRRDHRVLLDPSTGEVVSSDGRVGSR